MGPWDFSVANGAVNAVNAPLLRIVSRAYGLTDDRVSGPAWLDSECYDIHSKAAGNATRLELMGMLRELLKERFHMAARLESDERPVFVLSVEKGGSKLRPYGEGSEVAASQQGILFMARHMPDLCERIGKVTGRPVIDRTGLEGDFMIVLRYVASPSGDPAGSETDIVAAVREQLGLQLHSQRGLVDVLKVDRIEKVPTPN